MTGLLTGYRLSHLIARAILGARHTYLAHSIAHHETEAIRAAHSGNLYAWLNHLGCQADYLTKKVALHWGSIEQNPDDREDLCMLREKIQKIEPQTGPDAESFNVKLGQIKMAHGRLTCPPDPAYGILNKPN